MSDVFSLDHDEVAEVCRICNEVEDEVYSLSRQPLSHPDWGHELMEKAFTHFACGLEDQLSLRLSWLRKTAQALEETERSFQAIDAQIALILSSFLDLFSERK